MTRVKTIEKAVGVAEAKRRLSELLHQVCESGEEIVISRRGRPVARLVAVSPESVAGPAQSKPKKDLADVKGWLEDDDPFFKAIDRIVAERQQHLPRPLGEPFDEGVPPSLLRKEPHAPKRRRRRSR